MKIFYTNNHIFVIYVNECWISWLFWKWYPFCSLKLEISGAIFISSIVELLTVCISLDFLFYSKNSQQIFYQQIMTTWVEFWLISQRFFVQDHTFFQQRIKYLVSLRDFVTANNVDYLLDNFDFYCNCSLSKYSVFTSEWTKRFIQLFQVIFYKFLFSICAILLGLKNYNIQWQ